MEITITNWWWVIPIILTIATWVYFYIKEDMGVYSGNDFGISVVIYLILTVPLTLLYWLIYFIIF